MAAKYTKFCFLLILLSSCSDFENCQQAQDYIDDASNGLTKIIDYSNDEGVILKMSLWPNLEMQSSKEGEVCVANIGNNNSDNILRFKLHIQSIEGRDLLFRASKTKEDFVKLHQEVSFRFSNRIQVWSGSNELEILDCLLENNYELTGDKTILIYTYAANMDQIFNQDLKLVWNDDLFRLGINDFIFKKEHLKNFKERFKK